MLVSLVVVSLVVVSLCLVSKKEEVETKTEIKVDENREIENILYLANLANDSVNNFVIDTISKYACEKLNVTGIKVEINKNLKNCSGRYQNHIEIKTAPSSIIGAIAKCEKNGKTTGSAINLCTFKEKIIGTILHEYRHHYQWLNDNNVFDNYMNNEDFGYDAYFHRQQLPD